MQAVFQVASAPISSRFLCPRPPLLLSAPNQNRHATQARESEDEEYEEEFDSEEVESDNDYDLDGKSNPSQTIFSPYQMTIYAKLLFKVHMRRNY